MSWMVQNEFYIDTQGISSCKRSVFKYSIASTVTIVGARLFIRVSEFVCLLPGRRDAVRVKLIHFFPS